jgi:hypothetical protein
MLDRTEYENRKPAPTIWPVFKPYADQERWLVWRFETHADSGKPTKVPYQARNPSRKAKGDVPSTWATLTEALNAYNNTPDLDGIGLCLLPGELIAFDLDKCIDPETKIPHPWVQGLVARAQSYTEITPSGRGLRIIGRGTGDRVYRVQKVDGEMGNCETYRRCEKYITLTGNLFPGAPQVFADLDVIMDSVVAELNSRRGANTGNSDEEAEIGAGAETGNSGNSDQTAAETGAGAERTMPGPLAAMLHVPNTGAGEPHGGYATRSELVFAFVLASLRVGITGKTIAEECLNPTHTGYAIYEHCQTGGLEYVKRQIKQASEKIKEGFDAKIAEVNKTHAFVLAGNKSAVMKFEKIDDRDQFRLLQTGAFKDFYANHRIRIGKMKLSLGEYWMKHKERRQYEGIEFAPGAIGRDKYYNLWRRFSVEPREGNCSKFLAHLKDNVAQGNDAYYNWIVGWFAQIVQQLHRKTGTSLVLRGKQGVGKTIVGKIFGSLIANHYELVAEPRYVTGQFNSHMASLLVLHADEAFWAGDKRAEGKLKDLITGTHHLLEFKGIDPIRVNNYIRLFVTTNETWAVPAGFKERRFAIFDVGEGKIQDRAYFAAIEHEMENGGREALLHHLLNFDLTQVDVGAVPKTEALLEQIIESLAPDQAWWFDTLQRGELPWGANPRDTNTCPKRLLFKRYIQHARIRSVTHRSIETKIGHFLHKYVGSGLKTERGNYKVVRRLRENTTENGYIYLFPPLKECRARFAKEMGYAIKWIDADADAEWTHEREPDDEDGPM